VLDRAEEYRRLATEADKRASECRDPVARATYEKVAEHWRELAKHAEGPDSEGAPPPPSVHQR
jgi:hypothetical protein